MLKLKWERYKRDCARAQGKYKSGPSAVQELEVAEPRAANNNNAQQNEVGDAPGEEQGQNNQYAGPPLVTQGDGIENRAAV